MYNTCNCRGHLVLPPRENAFVKPGKPEKEIRNARVASLVSVILRMISFPTGRQSSCTETVRKIFEQANGSGIKGIEVQPHNRRCTKVPRHKRPPWSCSMRHISDVLARCSRTFTQLKSPLRCHIAVLCQPEWQSGGLWAWCRRKVSRTAPCHRLPCRRPTFGVST